MIFSPRFSVPRRVAITACGCVCPLGIGWRAIHDALLHGEDHISPIHSFDTSRCQCTTAGQVDDAQLAPAGSRRWHRATRMLFTVLQEAHALHPSFKPEICFMATTCGGMSFGEEFFRQHAHSQRHSPARLASYLPMQPVQDALLSLGWNLPSYLISNACASGTNAIGLASWAIRSGRYRRVLCGAYDAFSQLVFAGFESLKIMTPEKCRPFDAARTGLVLGEGAAVFFLEDLEEAAHRGTPILAEIAGYGVASDNHHLTQPEPTGAMVRLAIRRALADADFSPQSIDYINAHGTGTLQNDASEGQALLDFLPDVPVSSTKAMMGHALGAAGAIEAAFCLHALEGNFLPPNINLRQKEKALNLVVNSSRPASIRRVLSNSFGFGGANACIALQKV
ncbi:MAG: beta-ketoacyl-[acyl-carrier-protein] synthase family protein [Verrucomicrobia bacterium]|nr:MAG: beta-ketoacyl-[acyl-carrier-protein] synthase family protein [Verrucomicrobiota bacterium]